MKMTEYLESTQFAAKNLIDLINAEQMAIVDLRKSIKDADKEANEWWESIPVGASLEDYIWRSENTTFQLNLQEELKQELKQKLLARSVKEVSLIVLSGALLQLAKQGISLVHYSPYLPESKAGNEIKNSSNNHIVWAKPSVGNVNLKVSDLIVAARNQSMHYEEGLDNTHNIKVFEALETANPKLFQIITKTDLQSGIKKPKNFAKNAVLSLLKWKTYEQFEKDLLSIG